MHKLTRIIVPALMAATMFGAAGSASAQQWHGQDYNRGGMQRGYDDHRATPARAEAIRAQLDDLQRRVERNDRRDNISGREAQGLRREVANLRDQFRRANRDGLNDREFRVLQSRIDNLRARLHMERADWNGHRG